MTFLEEEVFDRTSYDTYLRRIHYEDRDAVMYENMLNLLWGYIVKPGCLEDMDGILSEYAKWNEQLVVKCYSRGANQIPYANIRKVYQSIICLIQGKIGEGLEILDEIGTYSFSNDGKAPKVYMNQAGKIYRPMSKLFVLYNYAKVLDAEKLQDFKAKYEFAFTCFGDQAHAEHDAFLKNQMEDHADKIFYPVFERVYKKPGVPSDFFVYYDEEAFIRISELG